MVWTEEDDLELQECLDRLQIHQKKLQDTLTPIGVIINNTKSIQTKILPSYTKNKEPLLIPPKDKWGEIMTDENRLEIKNQCIVKTNELLGEPDEQ